MRRHFSALHRALVELEVEVKESEARDRRVGVPVEVVLQDGSLAAP